MGSEGRGKETVMTREWLVSRVLRCILWHSRPRLTTARSLVHVLFDHLLLVSVGCRHRLFIVPLPSATSVQETPCPSSLCSVHISGKTVLKRSAKKKIHSSSIPELPNWYHRYRCCPSLCPKHCSQHWNRLYPKTDNVERSRGPCPPFISCCYQDEGAQWRRGSQEPQIIFGHVSFSLFSVSKCAYNLKGEHTSNQYTNTHEVLPHSWPSLPFPRG